MEYANVYPIFHYLSQDKTLNFKKGFPADLNKAMREGDIDVSPSSSIEYARYPGLYRIIPGISISSAGPVKSVNIFSHVPAGELSGKKVYFTKESNTSTVLCRIVLEKFYGAEPVYVSSREEADAELLIGDKALYAYYNAGYEHVTDLGKEWYSFTGLPFVFALWIAGRRALEKEGFGKFAGDLMDYAARSSENYGVLVGKYVKQGYTAEQMIDYWKTIDYRLEDKHLEGLRLFYKIAFEIGETLQNPEIEFC